MSSGLPIQLNLAGSNRTLGNFITAASVMLRDTMPIALPSRGARLNRKLVARIWPAPGMFSTTKVGLPGMKRGRCRLMSRAQAS